MAGAPRGTGTVKRRAKLSLASSQNITKKQAPGFESMEKTIESSRAQESPPPRPVTADTAAKSGSAAAKSTAVAGASSTPRPRQVLKVVVVLVATALSLYLLKRRFF